MKKIVMIALFFLLMTGCSEKKERTIGEQLDNISTDIVELSQTGITFVITDKNTPPYTYNEWYKIEKEVGEKWVELETKVDQYGFNSIGYPVDQNGEVKLTIDWEWLYGELEVGSYRIVKKVDNEYIYIPFGIANLY